MSATGALNPVLSTITARLPSCMFLISEASDDIDVDGLNINLREPYSKDPYLVRVPGQLQVTFSDPNTKHQCVASLVNLTIATLSLRRAVKRSDYNRCMLDASYFMRSRYSSRIHFVSCTCSHCLIEPLLDSIVACSLHVHFTHCLPALLRVHYTFHFTLCRASHLHVIRLVQSQVSLLSKQS